MAEPTDFTIAQLIWEEMDRFPNGRKVYQTSGILENELNPSSLNDNCIRILEDYPR